MNFKRGKSKRSVRCTLCTPHRWRGNEKHRFKERESILRDITRREIEDGRQTHAAPDQGR